MIKTAIQQIQLRKELNTEKKAEAILQQLSESGYDGIELCGFMIRKTPFIVRALMFVSGMHMGNCGKHDWHKLIAESKLDVISIHEDLNHILNNTQEVINNANEFNTKYIVITGMHHFDYSNEEEVLNLIDKLNTAGEKLEKANINLLYHNHNCEFRRVNADQTAMDLIIEKTDSRYVNFELDVYWAVEAGVNITKLMEKMNHRIKLAHLNDRGTRVVGKSSSILKSDSIELGCGNIDLVYVIDYLKEIEVDAIILETHKNWVNKSAVDSFKLSAKFLNKHLK